jgi:hypothetical protein
MNEQGDNNQPGNGSVKDKPVSVSGLYTPHSQRKQNYNKKPG